MWTRHTAICKRYKEERNKIFTNAIKAKERAKELAEMEAFAEAEKV